MKSTERFSSRVADYVKYRPTYPTEVVSTLERDFGITRSMTLADIGSGTGISAELFLREGYAVIGVEPNAAMRAAGDEVLAKYERFRSVDGTAEATTLPDTSVDVVIAAQAFHWFDAPRAREEIARIVKSGATVALVWNERLVSSPFLKEYESTLQTLGTDYSKVDHRNVTEDRIARFFAPRIARSYVFPHTQLLDCDAFLGRALSSSYVPAKGEPGHDDLVLELRRIFSAHASSGTVAFDYETKLFAAHF